MSPYRAKFSYSKTSTISRFKRIVAKIRSNIRRIIFPIITSIIMICSQIYIACSLFSYMVIISDQNNYSYNENIKYAILSQDKMLAEQLKEVNNYEYNVTQRTNIFNNLIMISPGFINQKNTLLQYNKCVNNIPQ